MDKAIVVCADDFGQSEAVSSGIVQLALQGRISATSAMVLSPRWATDAPRLHDLRGHIDVGLHLDWTSPFALAAGHGLPLGRLMLLSALRRLNAQAVHLAVERQLDAFETQWHAAPDHVDGHQHIQQFPVIREALVAALLRRYGTQPPWLRVSRTPSGLRSAKSGVIAAWGAAPLRRACQAHRIPHSPWLCGIDDFSPEAHVYGTKMPRWLAHAPPGSVLMCHPADGLDAHDPIAVARTHEFAFLGGPEFAGMLRSHGLRPSTGRTMLTPGSRP
jgi:hypothetical protein